jgi:hypothetical protein
LGFGDFLDTADQMPQRKDCRRENQHTDQRQDGLLRDHDDHESDERERIAAERIDDQIEYSRGGVGAVRDRHSIFRRMPVSEIGDWLTYQRIEQSALIFSRHPIAELRHRHRLAIHRETLDGAEHHRRYCNERDVLKAAVDVGVIRRLPGQVYQQARAAGTDGHEDDCGRIAPPMSSALLAQ